MDQLQKRPMLEGHDVCEMSGEDLGRREVRKSSGQRAPSRRTSTQHKMKSTILQSLLALSTASLVNAQSCISLSGSTVCPAFNQSSVSTDSGLVSSYPFLAFVSNTQQFDSRLSQYINTNYVQLKYEQILGCSNVNLSNTTDLYARYTASVVCNAIVQNSKTPCALSDDDSRPLCADSCAQQAISEQLIVSDDQTCTSPNQNAMDQIRADFTVCSLPSNSLSRDCITGASNEPDNCGFSSSLMGLCSYCSKSSPNATDSCCENSNLTQCSGVHLPTTTSMPPLFTSTASSTPTSSGAASNTAAAAANNQHAGLTGGQIAGIVVGAVIGAALILGLIIFLCLYSRRRGGSNKGSVFNSPAPARNGAAMATNPVNTAGGPQYEILPGGRIARMSALEGQSSESSPRNGAPAGAVIAGERGRTHDLSSSDEYGDSPESRNRVPLYPPPPTKRQGSISSGSMLAGGDPTSPQSGSGGEFSSPPFVASSQSEQLQAFKDYYSQDEIHPNDKVATLWAYSPRAGDEFELERGDMLKVVGIWDDGWATGVRIREKAEDWDDKRQVLRDSGVSNGSRIRDSSPPPTGEIKAFPLVCVCLPEHWRKTIEGDVSTETDSSPRPPTAP
ncbi:MAG: hypothetical protein M4579_001273 [Chaenotheca gracillima]|nr:MAG: hypothetical protein M4579_001273 [Chaenotheca gracillima]